MISADELWRRIEAHAGEPFNLTTGAEFTYEVPGHYLRPIGRVRHLSKANFAKALDLVPFENTRTVKDLQGPSYVFAILMDPRIRRSDW